MNSQHPNHQRSMLRCKAGNAFLKSDSTCVRWKAINFNYSPSRLRRKASLCKQDGSIEKTSQRGAPWIKTLLDSKCQPDWPLSVMYSVNLPWRCVRRGWLLPGPRGQGEWPLPLLPHSHAGRSVSLLIIIDRISGYLDVNGHRHGFSSKVKKRMSKILNVLRLDN